MEIKSYTSPVERTIDVGLRSFMLKIYNYMALGLCVTALAAFATLNTSLFNLFFTQTGMTGLGWVILLAPLFMVFLFIIQYFFNFVNCFRVSFLHFLQLLIHRNTKSTTCRPYTNNCTLLQSL